MVIWTARRWLLDCSQHGMAAEKNSCFRSASNLTTKSISFSMDGVDQLKTTTEGQRMLVWEFPSTRIKAINRIRVCRSKYVGIELSCQSVISAKLRLIPDEEWGEDWPGVEYGGWQPPNAFNICSNRRRSPPSFNHWGCEVEIDYFNDPAAATEILREERD